MLNKILQVLQVSIICLAVFMFIAVDNLSNGATLLWLLNLTAASVGLVWNIKREIITKTNNYRGIYRIPPMIISKEVFDFISDKKGVGSCGYKSSEKHLHDVWSTDCICRPALKLQAHGSVTLEHHPLTNDK